MTRAAGRAALAVALWLVGAGCAEAPDPARRAAPTASRATFVLEPPRLGLGEVAVLELAVITPPDHRPRAYSPPESVPGFWILRSL